MIPRFKPGWSAAAAILLAAPAADAVVATGPATNLTPDVTYSKVAPRISPSGSLIVYTDYTGSIPGQGRVRDMMWKKRGETAFHLTKWDMYTKQTEWGVAGPDDKSVWFHAYSQPNGRTDIWKYDTETGKSTQMTTNAAYDAFPAVSPDGTKLAFLSQRHGLGGFYNLYLMDATKPENGTDNVPFAGTSFPSATGVTVGRMVFTPDSKQVMFLYKDATMPRNEIYIADAADTDGDGWLDNMRPLTDIAAIKAGAAVGEPGGVVGDRAYFTANAGLDGTAKYHVYSVSLSAGTPNADVWQVSASNANENYVSVGADGMVVLAGADTSRGSVASYVDYYAMSSADETPSNISGTLPFTPAGGAANYLVELWNGNTKVSETRTDASGNWSFNGVRSGGYFLRFSSPVADALPVPISTVTRPVIAAPGQTVTVDVFSSPAAARRPRNLIPTIQPDGSVDLRFQPDPESQLTAGWTYTGFNVYRGTSENGPWTKIGAVSKDGPVYDFKDTSPGDLTKAFYSVTSVTTNGTDTLESWYSDAGQAANNLVFNHSFEIVGADNLPVGWSPQPMPLPADQGAPANENTWGATTDDAVTGTHSAYIQAAANSANIGDFVVNTSVPYNVPTSSTRAYIHGVYGHFVNAPAATTHTANTRFAYSWTQPNAGAANWYDAVYNGAGFAAGGAANPTTPWFWNGNVNPFVTYNLSTYTRLSVYWGANSQRDVLTPGVSRTVWDEYRFQEKRVGETGAVWGRVVDAAGTAVSGVTVSDGDQTVKTDTNGVFVIRESATGDHTVTISYPGQADITRQIKNIGGYVFNEVLAFPSVIPVTFGGRVYLPTGQPAAGAKVTYVVGNQSNDGMETVYTATTNAQGEYVIDDSAQPIDTTKKIWVSAQLAGYKAAYLADRSIAGGGAGVVGFDLTLGAPTPVIEIGKASVAPTIDGVVNPSEWAGSQEITNFVVFPTDTAYNVPTRTYALWDDNNLYVAMVADEPNPAGIVANANGWDDGAMWGDDNFQVFLDPFRSAGIGYGYDAWQFGINTNGAVTDGTFSVGPFAQALDTALTAAATTASTVDTAGKRWMAEAAIPIAGLTSATQVVFPPVAGTEWGGMFARYRSQDASNASTSDMDSKFAEPANWNTLRFVNTVSPPTLSALDALKIAAGLKAATSQVGDANSDGVISLTDAVLLLRKEKGLN